MSVKKNLTWLLLLLRLPATHKAERVATDEANGPIAKQAQRVCHDAMPWVISFSVRRLGIPPLRLHRLNGVLPVRLLQR
jgi:hypothetical protein